MMKYMQIKNSLTLRNTQGLLAAASKYQVSIQQFSSDNKGQKDHGEAALQPRELLERKTKNYDEMLKDRLGNVIPEWGVAIKQNKESADGFFVPESYRFHRDSFSE